MKPARVVRATAQDVVVATVENRPRASREAARVEAFSDGVFAIAVTLL